MDITFEQEDTAHGIQFIANSKKRSFPKGRCVIQLAAFRGKIWLHIQGNLEVYILHDILSFLQFWKV